MFGLSVRFQVSVISPIIRRCYSRGYSEAERMADLDDEEKEELRKSHEMRKWKLPRPRVDRFSQLFDISELKGPIFSNSLSSDPYDWVKWCRAKHMNFLKWDNRFIPERAQTLGSDLALAHFLIYRRGRVRKEGSSDFLTVNKRDDLPYVYERHWHVEEVDASGMDLVYEGLENFKNSKKLKIAAFRNCKYFDDWCLERIMSVCPSIQELDVSENRGITERGIEGLYRSWNLKKLTVTDWGHGPAFELTCMMLEDYLPDLTVVIKKPGEVHMEEGVKALSEKEGQAPAEADAKKE